MQIVSNGETTCMKCQILFMGGKKKEKYFNMSSAENLTQSAKDIKDHRTIPTI